MFSNYYYYYYYYKNAVAKVGEKIATKEEVVEGETFASKKLDNLEKELLLKINKIHEEFNSAKSVQEKQTLIKNLNMVCAANSQTTNLEEVSSPSVVVSQKGRNKNTKRGKIGLEYLYDEIEKNNKKQKIENYSFNLTPIDSQRYA